MERRKEYLANAEMAFAGKKYETALKWYQKVLEIAPDDVYVLSRAGALCVPLGKLAEAMRYFERAKKLNPENGDNAFNYGNACFFNKDYGKAFAQYVEAEKIGCSDDVKPRLYYQMALLCSMRRDISSALVYFQKCEESDPSGKVSLKPDLISEKLKLYMLRQDYAKAATCAAQLVAINPAAFRGYMIYFSILMAHKNYAAAQKLLEDAARYAQLSEADRFTLTMQSAALYSAQGNSTAAARILEKRKQEGGLTGQQLSQLQLALAEAYAQCNHYDTAIAILEAMLTGRAEPNPATASAATAMQPLTEDELEAMLQQDMAAIQEKIDTGVLDPDMGLYAPMDYDEAGNLVHSYDHRLFAPNQAPTAQAPAPAAAATQPLPKTLREKALFTLLTCHLAMDHFAAAQKIAAALKHSDNRYYSYFGLYVAAMTQRKLTGNADITRRKYAEAIAFFRNKTFADASDSLACIFRARLYAEEGKYEKAEELANLLADADRDAVLAYIRQCKA